MFSVGLMFLADKRTQNADVLFNAHCNRYLTIMIGYDYRLLSVIDCWDRDCRGDYVLAIYRLALNVWAQRIKGIL